MRGIIRAVKTETKDGVVEWRLNGKLHNYFEPALINQDGRTWYFMGKLHREDGPAVEYKDGYRAWYINGKLHREDGPAIIHPGGPDSYYLNGVNIPYEEYLIMDASKIPKLQIYQVIRS